MTYDQCLLAMLICRVVFSRCSSKEDTCDHDLSRLQLTVR